jgi:MoaA/NifB/PqqE/SkfB family radical SAM enzyme
MKRFAVHTRIRRAQRLLGVMAGRPLLGPQTVSLEVTHHCNLRCSFCESHGSLQPAPVTARRTYVGGRTTMDLDTVARLARSLARLGTDLVELSGKGDPITHPGLADIVRTIKGEGLGCAVVINGTLARPDLAATLVETGVDRVNLSLNASNREVYAAVTGRDLWERAMDFTRELLERRRASGRSRPWVRFSHVVFRDNATDLPGMVAHACEFGADEVTFYVMGELPETRQLKLGEAQVRWIRREAPGWTRRLAAAGIATDLPRFAGELEHRATAAPVQRNPLQERIPCYEGWMFCVIGPDGVVVPCCYCEDEVLGNVVDEDFERVWFGPRYAEFRRRALAMPRTGRWICEECFGNCNRAVENLRIHNRTHPLRPVR